MTEPTTDAEHLERIDAAIAQAARLMDMIDVSELPDLDEEAIESICEERHHCGTCEVRTVMEAVWPSIEAYIEWVRTSNA